MSDATDARGASPPPSGTGKGKKLPSHRGFLGVMEKKQWIARLVVIRDEDVPTISIYDASAGNPPDEKLLLRTIKLQDNVEVGDYMDTSDNTGRFTLKKPVARPNAFTLIVGNSSYGFEAANAEVKASWLDKLHMYIIKSKLREAAPVGQVGKLLPSHRGYLGVLEKKIWVARNVVLRDGVVPTLTVYDLAGKDPPDESSMVFEIKLQGKVDVGDYIPQNDLAGRLTMRKVEQRPNAFTLFVNEKPYAFEAATPEVKQNWIDKIMAFIVRYKLKDGGSDQGAVAATPFKGLPSHSGYLGVLEKNQWVARLVYVRDGRTPAVSVYDIASKDPPDEDMVITEIPLTGFVEVGDFKPADAGRLTLRAKAEPRPNSFSLIVNDKVYSFDAATPEVRETWMGKFRLLIDKYNMNENVAVESQTRSSLTNFVRKKRAEEAVTQKEASKADAETTTQAKPTTSQEATPADATKTEATPASKPAEPVKIIKNPVRQVDPQPNKNTIKGTVRGTMRGLPSTVPLDKLLPSHRGYLGVLEQKRWVARLVVIRDGEVPCISIYDASAADPPSEDMLIKEIPLTGNVEVGDFMDQPDLAGRLTLKKTQVRPNAFTLVVGSSSYGFEAANQEVKSNWIDKVYTFMVKQKLKDASGVGPAGKLLSSHRGFLGVYDKKAWTARSVVLRDGVIPTVSVYDVSAGDPPDENQLVMEIKLVGRVDVGDYVPEIDIAGRLTLRKAEQRPNAFNLVVNDKTYSFEAASEDVKAKWIDHLYQYIVRYKLKDALPAPTIFKGLPPHSGYLGVLDKSVWTARLVYLRDGPTPAVSIYDAASKDPPDESMLVKEIPLVGFVEVGEFKVNSDSGRLTFRSKAEPRPNGFTLLVNDVAFSFDAASPEVKQQWIGKFYGFIEKYKLNENAPVQNDSKRSITSFVRRKRPEDAAKEAAKASAGSGSPPTEKKGGKDDTDIAAHDLHNLPADVINPFADDYDTTFDNDLFGEDD